MLTFPRDVRTNLEEWCEDDSTCIAKLEGGEQLRQDLVFTEVFREGVQMVTQILKELLLLGWVLDLERIILKGDHFNSTVIISWIQL